MNADNRDMFTISRKLYFYVPCWDMEYISNILSRISLYHLNVCNMYGESHEFTFINMLSNFGLLKSGTSYLL